MADVSEVNDDQSPQTSPKKRRGLRFVLLVLGPLLAVLIGGYAYMSGGRYAQTENAYLRADKAAISSRIAGQISQVAVRENQHVEKGDVLFKLDDATYRVALDKAEARLQAVRAGVTAVKARYAQKAEALNLALKDEEYAKTRYKREAALAEQKVVSDARLDDVQHDLDTARQKVAVIKQEIAEIGASLGGDPENPVEKLAVYREALATRDEAALNMDYTSIRAPFSGVASKTPETGEFVKEGQTVMALVADTGLWVEANFKETELTYVRPGQPVSITVDTYPGHEWHGTVESISQGTGAEFSIIPAQNATGNWVKVVQRIPVRISIDDADASPDTRLVSGMSAIVEIDTGHRRSLPDILNVVSPAAAQAETR